MESKYSIPLSNIISDFKLEEIYLPVSADEIKISSPEVSRPGLALSGFVDVFEPFRIQIIGKAEHKYLSGLSIPQRAIRINAFFKMKPVAVVVTSNLQIYDDMLEAARAENIPLLRTEERTSPFMAALIALLNTSLAPRITRHGVLVEVYGEGVLILGDSGIGKSETAIELVKRGHRLIADDAVEIKRVSNQTLVGTAP
ncbi:MAG: HPr kinase/phosphorylase, partial [Clostridia bacterium]|nr:HPr kinase/phosphorylase [Clostridia bacterium]